MGYEGVSTQSDYSKHHFESGMMDKISFLMLEVLEINWSNNKD